MKLLFRRSHRSGLFRTKVIYVLDVRAELSEEERSNIVKFGLGSTRLYQRLEVVAQGKGLIGVAFRLGFQATNLSLSMADLTDGKRIECSSIAEVLSIEDEVKEAARRFSLLLAAAIGFDGEEVIDL